MFLCCIDDRNYNLAVKIVETKEEAEITEEVQLLEKEFKDLRHKRIVNYYGAEQKEEAIYIFSEYMAGVIANNINMPHARGGFRIEEKRVQSPIS